jgi:hypothetical protein
MKYVTSSRLENEWLENEMYHLLPYLLCAEGVTGMPYRKSIRCVVVRISELQ